MMNQLSIIIPILFFIFGFLTGYFLFFRKYKIEKQKGKEDYLTKVFNYREFDLRVHDFIRQSNQNIALALIDLDYFKRINDNYSYELGDEVLTRLVELISHQIRTSDLLFRFKNGDEFVIVFKDVQSDYLEEIGERLRRTIEHRPFSFNQKIVYLTASVGQTMVQHDDTKTSLLKRLESALKEAKSQRNKVFTM